MWSFRPWSSTARVSRCAGAAHGRGVRLGAIDDVEWRYCRSCGWIWTTRQGSPPRYAGSIDPLIDSAVQPARRFDDRFVPSAGAQVSS